MTQWEASAAENQSAKGCHHSLEVVLTFPKETSLRKAMALELLPV